MNRLKKIIRNGYSFFCVGFLLAFLAAIQPHSVSAANQMMKDRFEEETKIMKEKLELGNKSSPVKVYFITNWFCQACKKIEPFIEQIYPKIQDQFGVFFIDIPTHPESENYSPYNLSFLVNNKSQYMIARKMLDGMTESIEIPTYEEIVTTAKKNGIEYKELSYQDIRSGMSVFEEALDQFELGSTPMVVVINTKTNKVVKLNGTMDVTESKIMDAIKEVEK